MRKQLIISRIEDKRYETMPIYTHYENAEALQALMMQKMMTSADNYRDTLIDATAQASIKDEISLTLPSEVRSANSLQQRKESIYVEQGTYILPTK